MTYRLLRDPVGSWYYSETPALLHLWKQVFWSGGVFGGVFEGVFLTYCDLITASQVSNNMIFSFLQKHRALTNLKT